MGFKSSVFGIVGLAASVSSISSQVCQIGDGQVQVPNNQHGPPSTQLNQLGAAYNSPRSSPNLFWNGWGGDIYNNRWSPDASTSINQSNVVSLHESCGVQYHLGVSATPTVEGDVVYFPTWSGTLVALNYKSCSPVWEYNITKLINDYAPQSKFQSKLLFQTARTSAALDGDILYFGTQPHALIVALNKTTGDLIARHPVNPHPFAVVTMSPTVYDGKVYVGAASREEAAVRAVPNYQCCSFIGNMVSLELNASAGAFHVRWNVSTLPVNTQWSGGAAWGSSPSIDVSRSQVFVGTGNVYSFPDSYSACTQNTANISVIGRRFVSDPCLPSDVYQESVLAFDLSTGFLNWVRQLSPLDAWTAACGFGGSLQKPTAGRLPALCPYSPGPDADFGMAPAFIPGSANTPHGMDTLTIGQKNGNLYALSAQAGTIFWAKATSPDGNIGGLSWGIAVDDKSVYFTAINSDLHPFTLVNGGPNITSSAFGAANLKTGDIMWETRSPGATFSIVPPTVAGDVVFFGRTDNGSGAPPYDTTPGGLIPIDKYTGKILTDLQTKTTFHGGIAVVGEYVMFGTGYEPPFNMTGGISVWKVGA